MEFIAAQWRKLTSDFKKRRAVLKRLWMPVGLPLSLLLLIGWANEFVYTHGALSLPAASFLLFALVVLWAAPVPAIRVWVLRVLAFITDLVLLAIITFSVVWALRITGGKIGGPELMVVAWLWFFYFVFWDYWFGGTAGKRFFGLNLIFRGERSFIRCVLRTCLVLLLPLLLATSITSALQPDASPFRFFTALAVRHTVLALIPISILLFGGSQGIVDNLLSTDFPPRLCLGTGACAQTARC